jgi:imidazolonepropionase-like amidohydrolase
LRPALRPRLRLQQQPAAEQRPAATNSTLFEGARLITGDGGAPIEDSAFLIEADRITAVGKKGQIQLPQGATRVDLTGKTVMPALVDAHSHLGYTDVKHNTTAATTSRVTTSLTISSATPTTASPQR